jgi:hypothetical protein
MGVGPGELIILALVILPLLAIAVGLGALVYFLARKPPQRTCAMCGMPNVRARRPCPRCGTMA